MKELLNLEKELRTAFSSAITSFHAVGVETRDKMVELAIDMLKMGQVEAFDKWFPGFRAGEEGSDELPK